MRAKGKARIVGPVLLVVGALIIGLPSASASGADASPSPFPGSLDLAALCALYLPAVPEGAPATDPAGCPFQEVTADASIFDGLLVGQPTLMASDAYGDVQVANPGDPAAPPTACRAASGLTRSASGAMSAGLAQSDDCSGLAKDDILGLSWTQLTPAQAGDIWTSKGQVPGGLLGNPPLPGVDYLVFQPQLAGAPTIEWSTPGEDLTLWQGTAQVSGLPPILGVGQVPSGWTPITFDLSEGGSFPTGSFADASDRSAPTIFVPKISTAWTGDRHVVFQRSSGTADGRNGFDNVVAARRLDTFLQTLESIRPAGRRRFNLLFLSTCRGQKPPIANATGGELLPKEKPFPLITDACAITAGMDPAVLRGLLDAICKAAQPGEACTPGASVEKFQGEVMLGPDGLAEGVPPGPGVEADAASLPVAGQGAGATDAVPVTAILVTTDRPFDPVEATDGVGAGPILDINATGQPNKGFKAPKTYPFQTTQGATVFVKAGPVDGNHPTGRWTVAATDPRTYKHPPVTAVVEYGPDWVLWLLPAKPKATYLPGFEMFAQTGPQKYVNAFTAGTLTDLDASTHGSRLAQLYFKPPVIPVPGS